ncbi:MAG: YfhO family protein [Muribaculaceae bacterium]|nr:YfhO family protein [Muribaculaceae bacterium]
MKKITEFIKRPQVWGFFVSIAVLALLSILFFYPDNFEGNSLRQPDMQQGFANGQEAKLFEEATGEKALWTDALFGGMPTFQIAPSYPSNSLFTWLNTLFGLGLPAPSNLLFMMMAGFLILLFSLRMRWYYALIGAIAWGFSSYFIIIIGAGHIWKFIALTYIPPTIAGFVMLYRGRYVAGAALTALFAMLQLNANHPQMSYYFALVMLIIAICYLIEAVKAKKIRRWCAASAIAIGAGALALGANAPSLYNTYEYSKETKRSQSELTPLQSAAEASEPAERPTGGLPKSDIVGWSYGPSEMFTLIVPNIKGGASARPEAGHMVHMSLDKLDGASAFAATSPLLPYLTQYFNNSEGTNGPVYVGVIIFALFLLGCFIVKGPLKWAMVASTIIAVLLSLGYNAEWLTDWMIYNFPMYNKFRAVESILVVVEFAMPLLGIIALAQLLEAGEEGWRKYRRPLTVAFGFPALISLAAALWPSLFGEAITDADRSGAEMIQQQVAQYAQQAGYSQNQMGDMLYQYSLANPANVEAISTLRYGMVRADGWRSLLFLALAAGTIGLYISRKIRLGMAAGAIGLYVTADLYSADKRYLSHSSFGPGEEGGNITFTPDDLDRSILADGGDGHYRVLDIPGFYGATRSYFHKTVGGYHAAKLNRYEDIIQRKFTPMLQIGWFPDSPELDAPEVAEIAGRLRTAYRVADMLNTHYVITGDEAAPVMRNEHALGNAWLVDSIVWVDNADAEMAALDAARLDFARQAVADRRFAGALPEAPSLAPGDTIVMTSYTPNKVEYTATTAHGGVGVFSEIYFPWGWYATIDGKPAEIARVNYILRAIALPAGTHIVSMTFAPESIRKSSAVAYACVTLIYLLLAAGIFVEARRCRLF